MNIGVRLVVITCALLLVWSAQDSKSTTALELKASFDRLIKQAMESLPANVREPLKEPAVREALQQSDHKRVIELVGPVANRYADNVAMIPCFKVVGQAYSKLGDHDQAAIWARKEIEAFRRALKQYHDRPESVIFVQFYRRAHSRLPKPDTEDYAQAKAFLLELVNAGTYAPYQDFVLSELCALAYNFEKYEEVLETCNKLDLWYENRPPEERDRMLHDRWRSRVWFKQGKVEEAIALMEKTASHAGNQEDPIRMEVKEMKKQAQTK